METHGGSELAGCDMLAEVIRGAEKNLGQSLGPELGGLTIQRVLIKGGPAQTIAHAAQEEKADLVSTPSHGCEIICAVPVPVPSV